MVFYVDFLSFGLVFIFALALILICDGMNTVLIGCGID
jgi:hypothetical protein